MENPPRTTASPGGTDDAPGAPRWVKVFGIIAIAAALLFVILMFTRGPEGHGPGRHLPSRDADAQSTPAPAPAPATHDAAPPGAPPLDATPAGSA